MVRFNCARDYPNKFCSLITKSKSISWTKCAVLFAGAGGGFREKYKLSEWGGLGSGQTTVEAMLVETETQHWTYTSVSGHCVGAPHFS